MTRLDRWARRWSIPPGALLELHVICYSEIIPQLGIAPDADAYSETAISKSIRAAGSAAGVVLLRNNSGVGINPAGRPVRFGLGNDSKRLNQYMKSSDLIGWQVGGRFVAVEVKPVGWRYSATDREVAQLNFLNHVVRFGGIGTFATCWRDVDAAINS